MEGPRQRWLTGAHPQRTRLGAWALACLGALLLMLSAWQGLGAGSWAVLLLVAVPPFAGLAYAAVNGGPLLAVPVTQLGALLVLAGGDAGRVAEHAYLLLGLPAGLATFVVALHVAHTEVGGGKPLGEARAGAGVLMLWLLVVLAWAWLLTARPAALLGPALPAQPEWLGWTRSFALWGPAGFALGWAVVRRGPALVFAWATAPAWAWYLATWLGADAHSPLEHVGESLLPPSVNALRGPVLLGLGLLAMLVAVALEPAWPRRMRSALARGGAAGQQG